MKFLPRLLTLAALVPALFLSGCLQIDAVVKLKPDGSGTIEQKVMMTAAVVEQMKSMAQAFGGDKGGKAGEIYDEAKVKAQAAEMGEGVTFVSGKKATAADGSEGYTAIYAFSDISKVKLKPTAGALGGAGAMAMKSSSKELPVTFQFTKGKTAELTINSRRPKPEDLKKAGEPSPEDAAQDAMLPMMQQMFKDMRVNVAIEVVGKITETNAQWRDGSRITMMDVDMNKILADPVKFRAMTKIKDPNSAEAKALVAGIPGVKVELAEAVKVKFQ